MRRFLAAAASIAIALALGRFDAANATLATDGFAFDGKTTYCAGVRDPKAPLIFDKELVKSANQCPIALDMTATIRTAANSNAVDVLVGWSASLATGDVAQSLFPLVSNESRRSIPIIATLVRACKFGSRCATDTDMVVPAIVHSNATATGLFANSSHVALGSYVFGFPGAVDHIVVAKIVLPADPQLNISAIEFVTLQRVRSTSSGVVPATARRLKPDESQDRDANGSVASEADVLTFSPLDVNVIVTGTDNGLSTKTKIVLLSVIGGVQCALAIAYFAAAKRVKRDAPPHAGDNAMDQRTCRLEGAAKQVALARFPLAPLQPLRPWPAPPLNQPLQQRDRSTGVL